MQATLRPGALRLKLAAAEGAIPKRAAFRES
jgi:hypothetical protein